MLMIFQFYLKIWIYMVNLNLQNKNKKLVQGKLKYLCKYQPTKIKKV
jgi:hypothetical protein